MVQQDLTLYCCHNLFIGNDNFNDSHNVEGIVINWKHMSQKVKDNFQHSSNFSNILEGLKMKFQTHFIKSKGQLSTF